jgi:putative hydrolase of the HAD superfamily
VLTGIRAIAFDVNGTLVHILTEDDREDIFRAIGHFLTYQGIDLRRHEVRDSYFQTLKTQRKASPHEHVEFDAVAVWQAIIDEHATDFTRALPAEKRAQLPLFLAELYRGMTRRKLGLYPHVRQVLNVLQKSFALAVVTDAQSAWAPAELHAVGIIDYFDPIVISGDHGFRKPDKRLFDFALTAMGVTAEQTLYVGNDMHRDVFGAREAGMKTVLFDSDQGTKEHLDCVPDFRITDHQELLTLLGVEAG